MNWLRRIYNRWRYRPTLQHFWTPQDGERIVAVTPWRDLVVIATEYRVYVVSPGHTLLLDYEVQQIAHVNRHR